MEGGHSLCLSKGGNLLFLIGRTCAFCTLGFGAGQLVDDALLEVEVGVNGFAALHALSNEVGACLVSWSP